MKQTEREMVTRRSTTVLGRGNTGVRQVGLYARDPDATAEFTEMETGKNRG
jgi:hypothetical protein